MSDADKHKDTIENASKPFYKRWFVWVGIMAIIGILPILIFVFFLGYQFIIELPKAKQAQAQLEIEFSTIAPPPNARVVEHSASHKTSQALVDTSYLTDINPDKIFKYYDEQLKQHGWQPQGTKGVKDWGRDLGGKSADYCKGDYGAELQYAGEKANYGWTYAFSIDWGLNDCRIGVK